MKKLSFNLVICILLVLTTGFYSGASFAGVTPTSVGIADQVRNDTSTIATSTTTTTTTPAPVTADTPVVDIATEEDDIILDSDTILTSSSGETLVDMGNHNITINQNANIYLRGDINLKGGSPNVGVINIGADVNLYLEEGSETTLTTNQTVGTAFGIKVFAGKTLNINGSGKLNIDVESDNNACGIGGEFSTETTSTLVINDGDFDIDVEGSSNVVGIGATELAEGDGSRFNLTINDGDFDIDVEGVGNVAGIGASLVGISCHFVPRFNDGNFDIDVFGNWDVVGIGVGVAGSNYYGSDTSIELEKGVFNVNVSAVTRVAGIGFAQSNNSGSVCIGNNGDWYYNWDPTGKLQVKVAVETRTIEGVDDSKSAAAGIGFGRIFSENQHAIDLYKGDIQATVDASTDYASIGYGQVDGWDGDAWSRSITVYDNLKENCTFKVGDSVEEFDEIRTEGQQLPSLIRAGVGDTGQNTDPSLDIFKNKATVIIQNHITDLEITGGEDIHNINQSDTLELSATINPEDAFFKDLKWESSDSSIATVSTTGLVTFAGQTGEVTFTATAKDGNRVDGNRVSTTKTLTVVDYDILISSITLPGSGSYLYTLTGENTLQLEPQILPTYATHKQLSYESDNTGIATVDEDGLVTFTGNEGVVTFTGTALDGSGEFATKTITVTREVLVTSITLTASGGDTFLYKASGVHTLQLGVTVLPANATNKQVKYVCTTTNIATVNSSGLVTFTGLEGVAIFVALAKDSSEVIGAKAITVKREVEEKKEESTGDKTEDKPAVTTVKVSSISLTGGGTYLYKAKGVNTLQLGVAVLPTNATNKQVLYVSSNVGIATVNGTGLVTFTGKEGTVTITATAKDGSGIKGTKTITVCKNVTAIKVPLAKLYVTKGKKVNLNAVLEDNTDKTKSVTGKVTYTSSNKSSLSVDTNGNIKAKKKEKKTVTVTIKAANGKTLKVKVYIVKGTKKIKSLKVTAPKKLKKGNVYHLTLKPNASSATNLSVAFKSNKKSILSVSKSGKLVAHKKGKAKITVTVSGKKVTKTVIVA